MRSIVRRDTGESYEEFLRGIGEGVGHRDADARGPWRGWTASARNARRTRSGRVRRTGMRGLRR